MNVSTEQAKFIARVLAHQGSIKTAADDIYDDLCKIERRYTELKHKHGVEAATNLANAEWIENYLNSIEPKLPELPPNTKAVEGDDTADEFQGIRLEISGLSFFFLVVAVIVACILSIGCFR